MELHTDGLEFFLGAAGTPRFQLACLLVGGYLLFQATLSQFSPLPVSSPGSFNKATVPCGSWLLGSKDLSVPPFCMRDDGLEAPRI